MMEFDDFNQPNPNTKLHIELIKEIQFKLEYLDRPERLTYLSESDMEWLERMRGAFTRQGTLTEKQLSVLDNLWEKAT